MRTTVTLDPDADAIVRRLMKERGLSFKQAVNTAIKAGSARRSRGRPFRTRTYHMGSPMVPIDQALRLAAELEDEELIRKIAARK
jgi:hypothetical protein